MSIQEKERVEYWENGFFQCVLDKQVAEEILKDHKHWGNRVRKEGIKFHVEIRGKNGEKGKSNKVTDDLPAGQPTVNLGVTTAYVE